MTTAGHETRQPIGVLESGLVIRQLNLTKHGAVGPYTASKFCFINAAVHFLSLRVSDNGNFFVQNWG